MEIAALQAISAAASVIGAIGQYQAGQAQKQQYYLQAQQTEIESQRKAIQYGQRSNDVLRRRMQANAALSARAYAGGVDPFSGSPDIVRAANDTAAGREYARLLEDADAALRAGFVQADIYRQAGQTAARTGAFQAVVSLGAAAASYSKTLPKGGEVTYGGGG